MTDTSVDIAEPPSRSTSPLKKLGRGLKHLFKRNHTLKESLEEVIEEHDEFEGGTGSQEERAMLQNVLSFGELKVEDVMVPRADIEWVDFNTPFDELKQQLVASGHTRIPVCRDVLDHVAGFVHVKDVMALLVNDKAFSMEAVLRHTLFVPPSMKSSVLLVKMQLSRVHIAMVVDEYGGICGLVTLEDIMEEIVGEIEDEHDVEGGELFMQVDKNRFEVSARLQLEELEQYLNLSIQNTENEDKFDTLGGLLFSEFGHVPVVGEMIAIEREDTILECEVLEADPRRIKRVLIRRKIPQRDTQPDE